MRKMREIKNTKLKRGQFLMLFRKTDEDRPGGISSGIGDVFFVKSTQGRSKQRGLLLGSIGTCSLVRIPNKNGKFHLRRTIGGAPSVIHYDTAYVMFRKMATDYI